MAHCSAIVVVKVVTVTAGIVIVKYLMFIAPEYVTPDESTVLANLYLLAG
jgi:hypothetical protein